MIENDVQNIAGGEASDQIEGNDGNNKLAGNGGDDTINGKEGNDDNDGGTGVNTVSYAGHDDGVNLDLAAAKTAPQGSIGEKDANSNFANAITSAYDDDVTGTAGANKINTGRGDDTARGLAGGDRLVGGFGHDSMFGGADGDTVISRDAADDTAIACDTGDDSLTADPAPQDVATGCEHDVRDGASTLTIEDGFAYYKAGSGEDNDLKITRSRNNLTFADYGTDEIVVSGSAASRCKPAPDSATVQSLVTCTTDGPLDQGIAVETLDGNDRVAESVDELVTVDAGDGNDYLQAGGTPGAGAGVLFDGGAGSDQMKGSGSAHEAVTYKRTTPVAVSIGSGLNNDGGTIDGTRIRDDVDAQIDDIYGSDAPDTLVGSSANNAIYGSWSDSSTSAGDVLIDGGAGNDTLRGTPGADKITGGSGSDSIWGGLGADAIDGGADVDAIHYDGELRTTAITANLADTSSANDGADGEHDNLKAIEHVHGTEYSDALIGDNSINHLYGMGGDDHMVGYGGADILDGGEGHDWARYDFDNSKPVTVILDGIANDGPAGEGDNVKAEDVTGTSLGDVLVGDGGDNRLGGNGGDDVLAGGKGNDNLIGGEGKDNLIGNEGADTINAYDAIAGAPADNSISCGSDPGGATTARDRVTDANLNDPVTAKPASTTAEDACEVVSKR